MSRTKGAAAKLVFAGFAVFFLVIVSSRRHLGSAPLEERETPLSGKPWDHGLTQEERDSVQFIPHDVVQTWRRSSYLVAVGFLSPDNNERRRRRQLLRVTSMKYGGMANRANGFTGVALATFILARHPGYGFQYSQLLKEEAQVWNDVISLPMNEGRVSTNKKIGDGTHWGPETEIGMSRKVYFWFSLALRLMPTLAFVSKADDDAFLHVPQFLADLSVLPRRRAYWGYMKPMTVKDPFYFAAGILYTLSRDVAEAVVAYEPLQRLVRIPYSKEREREFGTLIMENEDIMVARIISYLKLDGIQYYVESCCRFNDLNYGFCSGVRDTSVIIHGVKEDQYVQMVDRLRNYKAKPISFYRGYIGMHAACM
ncbi:hypothetical protein ERJ75_000279300 [Trypanosoma vivax]|uniref:Hexosyltransferase n=1 Tax=Trypanosoma vivax (strain Y486) TaxID=1055687 RepID=G0TUT6_TRYVY|nr:putative UDP-Gal or UDP-GlcNAc-dependent glycosyltransferase [Trypanosoma vivax]KAH8618473.1 hypothetical protein ERJ75_000279300 [Trypanosoma vivax]CCC47723.1 putative UDP-Gal or UDP-GlcNAc-dependent glycosyltransferase [Trypanosoma vivax Y486]